MNLFIISDGIPEPFHVGWKRAEGRRNAVRRRLDVAGMNGAYIFVTRKVRKLEIVLLGDTFF